MSRVYSPYLGRYVRKFVSQVGSVHDAHARSFVSPLAATGDLVSYGFPSSAEAGKESPWSCDVHNAGTDGVVAFGIVNAGGNPGSIVVKWEGKEATVEPGYYLRIFTSSVPYCTHLITSGKVVFLAEGSYTVRLWGMHQEGESWFYDEEVTLTVSVVPSGGGQKWPVERSLTIFDGEILQANQWETGKGKESTEIGIGDSDKYLGARLEYSITYLEGNAGLITVGINVNNVNQVSAGLKLTYKYGPPVPTTSGTKEVTTPLYLKGNKIRIGHAQPLVAWSKVAYTVKLVIGFSSTPSKDPSGGAGQEGWEELLEKYKWWIAGGAGLAGIYLLTRKGQPLIVMTQPYYPRESRKEET